MVLVDYIDVARQVFDEQYMGLTGLIPHDIRAGEIYTSTASAQLYGNIKDMANMKTIVAIINAANGEVINVARFAGCEFVNDAGVYMTDESRSYEVTVIDGRIFADGVSDNLEVWSVAGTKVNNAGLATGIYIVRLPDNTITKVMVR